jgi:hypothetical protein
MRTLAGELGVTRVKIDEASGTVDFDVNAETEVKEMLVDNLDEMYRKDLTVTPTTRVPGGQGLEFRIEC